jgi:hypothetical protein
MSKKAHESPVECVEEELGHRKERRCFAGSLIDQYHKHLVAGDLGQIRQLIRRRSRVRLHRLRRGRW